MPGLSVAADSLAKNVARKADADAALKLVRADLADSRRNFQRLGETLTTGETYHAIDYANFTVDHLKTMRQDAARLPAGATKDAILRTIDKAPTGDPGPVSKALGYTLGDRVIGPFLKLFKFRMGHSLDKLAQLVNG